MPRATEILRAQFEDDGAAWLVLKNNFSDNRGIIYRKNDQIIPTDIEFQAIDYLCQEWDYGWNG